jgi:hypothetical protein
MLPLGENFYTENCLDVKKKQVQVPLEVFTVHALNLLYSQKKQVALRGGKTTQDRLPIRISQRIRSHFQNGVR